MALVPASRRVGPEFGVKRVVFSMGTMSGKARRLLRKRLGSELDAVRNLMRKAESFRPGVGGGPSGEAGTAAVPGEKAAEPHPEATPMEVDGSGDDAKRRKVSPLVVQRADEEQKRAAPDDERSRLAERLATLAASLPDHVVAFLQNHGAGDGDLPRGGGGSGTEMDMRSMVKDGALFQLKLLLDRFAPAESTPEKNRGRAAAPDAPVSVSCLSQHPHQDAANGKGPVEEKKGDVAGGMRDETGPAEKQGGVVGGTGASGRILLRDIAEEYGELVEAVGVLLLSPLPRRLVELEERGGGGDEYVDICGDASPVVLPCVTCKAVEFCSSPSSSSGGCSGASSSSEDSEDTSWSSSDSSDPTASDSHESVGSPSRPPGFDTSPQKPAPMAVWIAEAEEIRRQHAPPTPTVRPITISPPAPSELPKESDVTAQISEAVQITKPEAVQNQCTAPAPTVPLPPKISSPPAALSLSKVSDTSSQPPQPPEAAYSVEPEELKNQSAVVTAPTEPPTNSSPRAPLPALPSENGASAQPPPPPAPTPDAAHIVIAEPEVLHQDPNAAPASPAANDPALTDLIARAQEAAERRRREEINRERHRARQELVEMERAAAAVPDDHLRPQDMEVLGIAEHVVSIVERTAAPGSGCPTVMQFLGLFLKAEEDEEREQTPAAGADMDVEEGEIW